MMCNVLVLLVFMSTTYQASGRGVANENRLPEADPHGAGFAPGGEDTRSILETGTWHKRENVYDNRYLQNQDGKYISVTAAGAVVGRDNCNSNDLFTYTIRPDKSSNLYNKATGRYLAIDSSGKLTTSLNGRSADADLALERAPVPRPRHFYIYRMDGAGGKLYLAVSKPNQKVSVKDADVIHVKSICN